VIGAVAVAAGPVAAEHLAASAQADPETAAQRHADMVVAWPGGSPWIDTDDDGNVLIVLDGRLHGRYATNSGAARHLRERYALRGDDVARGLLGDFVLVILDRARERLLVARDPVGVRPWYRADVPSGCVGASDLASVATVPGVDLRVDERVALEHLAAVPESRGPTLYRGVSTLRPGQTWMIDRSGGRTWAHHRWTFVLGDVSWDEAAERCRVQFEEAVGDRARAGGGATSELSGGFDSSIVVGTLCTLGFSPLVVGRLVFDGPRADERAFSDAVLQHWGLAALSVPPWIPTPDEADALTRRLRRPLPDPHFTMFVGLQRAFLAAGRTEGQTGLGGDDAFVATSAGARVLSAFQQRRGRTLFALARDALRRPAASWAQVVKPTLHHLAPWKGPRPPGWLRRDAMARVGLDEAMRRRPEAVTGVRAVDERIANLTTGYDAAVLEERAVVSDALGGWRGTHPFLDPRVIEATYGLDPWWPTRGGHDRALQVHTFAGLLPEAVLTRRSKAEFSEVFWPQLLSEPELAALRTGPLCDLGFLDHNGFDQLVADARSGMARSAIPLARCRSLDRWLRTL
jgi:asparagine synthetase B (glutamine-hydrolysing)